MKYLLAAIVLTISGCTLCQPKAHPVLIYQQDIIVGKVVSVERPVMVMSDTTVPKYRKTMIAVRPPSWTNYWFDKK